MSLDPWSTATRYGARTTLGPTQTQSGFLRLRAQLLTQRPGAMRPWQGFLQQSFLRLFSHTAGKVRHPRPLSSAVPTAPSSRSRNSFPGPHHSSNRKPIPRSAHQSPSRVKTSRLYAYGFSKFSRWIGRRADYLQDMEFDRNGRTAIRKWHPLTQSKAASHKWSPGCCFQHTPCHLPPWEQRISPRRLLHLDSLLPACCRTVRSQDSRRRTLSGQLWAGW